MFRNFYEFMEITPEATTSELKKAYRKHLLPYFCFDKRKCHKREFVVTEKII